MRIGELALGTGLTVETIRWYEAQGLIPAPLRGQNNYRIYGVEHQARLLFISRCRRLGMGLKDIRKIIECDGTDREEAERVHAVLHEKMREVERHIRELEELREQLSSLERCCHGHGRGMPCGIIERLLAPAEPRRPD